MGTPTKVVVYGYGSDDWGDLLTSYDGNTVTYDGIGNPLSDGTWTYTWQHGRQLEEMSGADGLWQFLYDVNGMRTLRTDYINYITYRYVYNGSQLTQMSKNNDTLYFAYDAAGKPLSFTYGTATYYYVTNLQGDVVAILDSTGTPVVSYTYNAWGKVLSVTGSMASTLGYLNPLTYRGYIYDWETGLYYLQSRYYNPQWCRFINADSYVSTGQGFVGNNMFAYCNNNPVCNTDSTGCFTDGQIHDIVLAAIAVSYVDDGYYYLETKNSLIYYNGKNWKNGWGFCDLYDSKTGEVWELKKDSKSYTCTTAYANRQLGKYVNGRLARYPSLQLSRGGFLIDGVQTHVVSDSKGTYYIEYWEQGNGILRYRYTLKKNTSTKVLNALCVAGLVIGGGLLGASLFVTGGASAPGVAAATPIIIEWISRAA